MTNDAIKNALLSIEDSKLDFTVTQSGKKSRKVHGLYKPETREIILHNKNFERDGKIDENLLLYTAIHEYAHHQHSVLKGGKLSARAHTSEFWAIFHGLLDIAETKGFYKNNIETSPELKALTEKIRSDYLKQSGELLKEFGALLSRAFELCEKAGLRFEDYIDRVLCIPRNTSKLAFKLNGVNVSSAVGADNMKFLAGIKNDDEREACETALLSGKSPDSVRAALKTKTFNAFSKREMLEKEKTRIQHTIETLEKRLKELEKELDAEK